MHIQYSCSHLWPSCLCSDNWSIPTLSFLPLSWPSCEKRHASVDVRSDRSDKRCKETTSTALGWDIQDLRSLKELYAPPSDYDYETARQRVGGRGRTRSESLTVGCPPCPALLSPHGLSFSHSLPVSQRTRTRTFMYTRVGRRLTV